MKVHLFHRLWTVILQLHPIRQVVLGYTSYILAGWGLLCLPLFHQVRGISPLDHLFMATSAVSTTGLTTVSTADTYNLAGEILLLVLIQLGGLGYMTLSSFVALSVSGSLSVTRERISGTAMTLPEGFNIRAFLRVVCWFTLLIEAAGALALYPVFARHGAVQPAWQALFHSVSAFCTAGFGLFNDSFESFRDDAVLNVVISTLSLLGGIGFIVLADLWKSVTHRKPSMTLTSKVILLSTGSILVVGTLLFALDEPAVRSLPAGQRWMASLFQVMTASTTVGFNTLPIGGLSASSALLLTLVMVIGASPSGTGGGLKTTTVTALWASMVSVVRQRAVVTFLGREIPRTRLRAATANLVFYLLTLSAGSYVLALVEKSALPDLVFEAASALGTVGLSRGVTGSLTVAGKITVVMLMWAGRIGPMVLGMAFFSPESRNNLVPASEDMAV